MDTMTRTPQQSPTRRVPSIPQAQKQALVDNLQLEITERARKLRAQYALQAQGLRARLDLRVNRIPQALRKRNIQELIDEHHVRSKPAPAPPVPVAAKPQTVQAAQPMPSTAKPAPKRKSDEISIEEDKENMPAQPAQDIPNPKKRTKTVVTANSKATRARNAGPAGVLSPRSHNSRNLPQSPIKPMEKTYPPRPMSAQTTSKPTRAPSRQAKRPMTANENDSGRTSEGSNTSAGTTIITKPGTRKAATTKKTIPARPTTATATRKAATTKPTTTTLAAATRTLRSRN